jgi:hypothetical protein
MKFNFFAHRDDWLFVIVLLLPAVVAGTRFLQSEREMTQIVQARAQAELAAADSKTPKNTHLALAQSQGR